MMSNGEDQCFQCQEPGYIIHDTALTSSAINVMNLDTSSWTALTEYPLQGQWHHTTRHTEIATKDLTLETTRKT